MSRYARRCDAAEQEGDRTQGIKWEKLMDKACADLDRLQGREAPKDQPGRVQRHTAASTAHLSDEELGALLNESWGDPQAVDDICFIFDERQRADDLTKRERGLHVKAVDQVMEEYRRWDEMYGESLLSPGARPSRRLSAREQLRADYESYVDCQYLQAEYDCKGVLVTAEATAKGISPRSLFSGSIARATKYASPELLSWWGRYGRLNYAAFRYGQTGERSARDAAERVRMETFDMAPAWGERSD